MLLNALRLSPRHIEQEIRAEAIGEQYEEGHIITAVSYSKKTEEYIAILTESGQGQEFSWEDSSCDTGYKPTIIFQDPVDNKILYIKTTGVGNVDEWSAHGNYEIMP